MKKEYLIPEMEITMLENYDIVTSSPDTESLKFNSSETGKAETAAAMNENWLS